MADEVVSLLQWQRRFPEGKVPEARAHAALHQLVAALHRVHCASLCHRDIVPATIRVTTRDDGTETFDVPELACAAENHGEPGARRYLAPEQWWGARQNTATDQYALAVLFIELVTGTVPFADAFATEDETVMRTAVCNRPPQVPADCPRRDVVLRALEKDPRSRYPSCSAFRDALEGKAPPPDEIADEAGEPHRHHHHHHHHHHHPPAPQPKPKKKFPWGALLLLAALGAGVGAWGAREGWWRRFANRLDGDGARERTKQLEAMRQLRAQEEETAAREREAQLTALRAEIARQEAAAKQALADYQKFLEAGGTAVLAVRRDTLDAARRTAQDDLKARDAELAAAHKLAQAMAALKVQATAYGSVAKDIPETHPVAAAYKTLADEAAKLSDLEGRFTEKHPTLVAQRKTVEAAFTRFRAAIVAGNDQAQAASAAKQAELAPLRAKAEEATRAYEAAAGACEVARLKEAELAQAHERATTRLADLRRRELDLAFGGGEEK